METNSADNTGASNMNNQNGWRQTTSAINTIAVKTDGDKQCKQYKNIQTIQTVKTDGDNTGAFNTDSQNEWRQTMQTIQ